MQAFFLVLLTVIWGTTWGAIRLGLEDIPPLAGAAMRFAIASSVLLVVAWARGVPLGRERRERWLWLGNGLLSFVGSYGLVYWGEQYVPSGLAALIFASFPLFMAVLAHFFLPEERMTLRSGPGALVGFAGVAVLFSEDFHGFGGGSMLSDDATRVAALMLIAPFSAAVGQLVVKRWGQGLHPLSLTAMPMAICAAVMGAGAALFESDRPLHLTPMAVGSAVYLGLVGSALAFYLYFHLLNRMPASRLALVAYVTPAVAVAVGTLVFDEPFTLRLVVAFVTILAGVALAGSGKAKGAGAGTEAGETASESAL